MTIIINQHEKNGYYIRMCAENEIYIIEAYEKIGGLYSYPFKKMIYSVDEEKKAEATFKRYVKKYSV